MKTKWQDGVLKIGSVYLKYWSRSVDGKHGWQLKMAQSLPPISGVASTAKSAKAEAIEAADNYFRRAKEIIAGYERERGIVL